jgi:hypothetical protein
VKEGKYIGSIMYEDRTRPVEAVLRSGKGG